MEKTLKFLQALASVVIAIALSIGVMAYVDQPVEQGGNWFGTVTAEYLTATSDLTVGGLTLNGFANETITDGETLTPAYTVYALDSAGAVATVTLAASATEGQLLILIGDDANDIIVADTNVRTSTGAALTINQYDIIGFVYQDSEWIELFTLADS